MIKKIPLLPNAITAFGLTCGLFVIFKVNMVDPGEGTYMGLVIAAVLLIMAAVADLLDGAVARIMKMESEFGGLFDSLADAISFGVAPSVIVMKNLAVEPGTNLSFSVMTAAIIYSLCGVLRLVRFSVSSSEAKNNVDMVLAHKKNFTGLPIPAAAAAIVSLTLFLFSPEVDEWFEMSDLLRAWLLAAALFFCGYLMISRWRFSSLKTLQVRVASFQLVFCLVGIAVAVFYGILHHFSIAFFLVAWTYLMAGLVLSTVRIIAGRRVSALDDFEPDPPEE